MDAMPSPRLRYQQHKSHAKQRGIEFDLTFDEWWAIWEPRYDRRGPHKGEFVMCRAADQGAYRPGNVRIDTVESNNAERGVSMCRSKIVEDWGEGRGPPMDWISRNTRGFPSYLKLRQRHEYAIENGLCPLDSEEDGP